MLFTTPTCKNVPTFKIKDPPTTSSEFANIIRSRCTLVGANNSTLLAILTSMLSNVIFSCKGQIKNVQNMIKQDSQLFLSQAQNSFKTTRERFSSSLQSLDQLTTPEASYPNYNHQQFPFYCWRSCQKLGKVVQMLSKNHYGVLHSLQKYQNILIFIVFLVQRVFWQWQELVRVKINN